MKAAVSILLFFVALLLNQYNSILSKAILFDTISMY